MRESDGDGIDPCSGRTTPRTWAQTDARWASADPTLANKERSWDTADPRYASKSPHWDKADPVWARIDPCWKIEKKGG